MIKLDMATALVASVTLGLSVDDTFHCLLQFHRQRKHRFRQRLFESYRVSGPGVLLSSVAVAVGFAALRASEFEPFVNFGTMVGIATAARSARQVLGNTRQFRAAVALTRWLRCRSGIPVRGVIGHNESLRSPYYRELVPAFRGQTHGDFNRADMNIVRTRLAALPCRA